MTPDRTCHAVHTWGESNDEVRRRHRPGIRLRSLPEPDHETPPLPKLRHPDRLGLHLRVVLEGGVAVGPGRADLLEAIRDTGSISAAGRALTMSYKRAWDLVEEMNTSFRMPLVTTSTGGPSGGGSRLTETGETVLAAFRAIEAMAAAAASDKLRDLAALLAPAPSSARPVRDTIP